MTNYGYPSKEQLKAIKECEEKAKALAKRTSEYAKEGYSFQEVNQRYFDSMYKAETALR
jgi:hypothetical protein